MKYAVVFNDNQESKYVGSLSDYKCGEFSADPILMSEEEATELFNELDRYVRDEEYIGKNDEDNEQAHWAYDNGEWGFSVEEFNIIETLQELAEYINSDDYNQLEVNRIVEDSGWHDLSGDNDYDVCSFAGQKVTLDQNTGKAKVVDDFSDRIRIGQRIAEQRKAKGMTQSDLAKASGVTLANISRMERGMYSPGLDVLTKIADALGAKIDIV